MNVCCRDFAFGFKDFFLCMSVLSVGISLDHICAVPKKDRRGCQSPSHWSNNHLAGSGI